MDDWRLLRQYLDQGSEAAFGRLVERHIRMVYWTCRRDLGNDQLAEDATQAVFINLARHAPLLKAGASIAGWLFTTARYAARNISRSEQHRLHYEQEAAQAMNEATASEACWEAVEPWLNDGLSQLCPSDRELLLLRYFEGASFSDVARACGIAEPAARKRVSRALDRLRHYLARKEATVTSAALLALLAEHSAKAAPAGCQASVLQAVKANAPVDMPIPRTLNPLIGKGLLIVSTSKIAAGAAVAVVLILGLTFAVVHHTRSSASTLPPSLANQPFMASATGSDPLPVLWQAPALSDPATEQALATGIWQFREAHENHSAEEYAQILSPDFTIRSSPSPIHYAEFMQGLSGVQPRPDMGHPRGFDYRSPQIVTACNVTGNTATVIFKADGAHSPLFTFTFTNTGNKWLITSADFGRRRGGG